MRIETELAVNLGVVLPEEVHPESPFTLDLRREPQKMPEPILATEPFSRNGAATGYRAPVLNEIDKPDSIGRMILQALTCARRAVKDRESSPRRAVARPLLATRTALHS